MEQEEPLGSDLEENDKGHVIIPDWHDLTLPERKKLVKKVVSTEYGERIMPEPTYLFLTIH